MSDKVIYRDFNHWWSRGKHGFSSASRDLVQDIWNDLEPTILASRDDYKNAYVQLMKEHTERKKDVIDAALKYIELHSKEDAPKFWRWYMDEAMKDFKEETE